MFPVARFVWKTLSERRTPSTKIIIFCIIGFGDLQFRPYGYAEAICSVLAQSVYLTYVQKTGVEKNVSALSVLHLNSINCILPLFAYTLWNGNLKNAVLFEGFYESSFRVCFYACWIEFDWISNLYFLLKWFSLEWYLNITKKYTFRRSCIDWVDILCWLFFPCLFFVFSFSFTWLLLFFYFFLVFLYGECQYGMCVELFSLFMRNNELCTHDKVAETIFPSDYSFLILYYFNIRSILLSN